MPPKFAGLSVGVLRMFVRVVETGNVSAAARSLYIAQSAVSTQLGALARNAGTPLLDRSSGRWEPTAEGRLFYDTARSILAQLDTLDRDLDAAALPHAGRFRMASTRTVSDTILAGIVAEFRTAHPAIRIDVVAGDRRDAELRLASDDVDLALVALPLVLRGLEVAIFAEDELVLVTAHGHALATSGSATIDDLRSEPIVMFAPGSGVRALLEERLGATFATLEIVIELASNDAIVAAVEVGLRIAFLPRRTAERWQRCGNIASVPLTGVDLRRPLAIVRREQRIQPVAAQKFTQWLLASSNDGHRTLR